jgi:hypothetical protein
MTSKGRVILFDGKKYHDKAVRAKYKDRLKPFAVRLQQALDEGIAVYAEQKPKHIYTYQLRRN